MSYLLAPYTPPFKNWPSAATDELELTSTVGLLIKNFLGPLRFPVWAWGAVQPDLHCCRRTYDQLFWLTSSRIISSHVALRMTWSTAVNLFVYILSCFEPQWLLNSLICRPYYKASEVKPKDFLEVPFIGENWLSFETKKPEINRSYF